VVEGEDASVALGRKRIAKLTQNLDEKAGNV
jgi:hypothetical protein